MHLLNKITAKLFNKPVKKLHGPEPLQEDTMVKALERAYTLCPVIHSIIDVGAAQGMWTEKALPLWPQANYLLLEPLKEREQDLQMLNSKFSNVNYLIAAAADKPGFLELTVTDDLDGSGFYGKGNLRRVEVVKIDDLVTKYKLTGPYLIK